MESLLREHSFLTTADAAALTNTTTEAAAHQLEAAALALAPNGARVLYAAAATWDDGAGGQRVTLLPSVVSADKVLCGSAAARTAGAIFAALLPSDRAAAVLGGRAAVPITPGLCPRFAPHQRAYPLVSRAALEKEALTGVPAAPLDAKLSTPSTPSAAAGARAPLCPLAINEAAASCRMTIPTEKPAPVVPPVKAETTGTDDKPTRLVKDESCSAVEPPLDAAPKEEAPPAVPTAPVKTQASLFDMMRTASANAAKVETASKLPATTTAATTATASVPGHKRSRAKPSEGEKASEPKAARKAKAAKVEKEVSTTSLAKLAKASARKRKGDGVQLAKSHAPMRGLLDDDEAPEQDDSRASSSADSAGRDDSALGVARMSADASVLDVTETVANDEIILCDDAPPLAFLSPALAKPPATTATTANASAHTASGSSTAAARAVASGTQSTLGSFFNAAVVQFQRGYVRKVRTETKKDASGEYSCFDVPYYEPLSGAGECLSEEAYHRRSTELANMQRGEQSMTDNSGVAQSHREEAGDGAKKAEESPEAGQSKHSSTLPGRTKHGSRPVVAKVAPAEKAAPETRTLLSFFNRAAS